MNDYAMLTDIFGSGGGIWFMMGAALVFFMQCGFAMVETGFTRAKNAGNIIMKNLMDFCIGTVAFYLLGYNLLCGDGKFVGWGLNPFTNFGETDWSAFVFNLVFCATAATIVSGAMAERTKFITYCIYSFIISLCVYPIEAHWVWGGTPWLTDMGFTDFAGSACIHMVGGITAFIGAAMLGPRIGKYDKNGKPKPILGHNLLIGALGVFILWFGWYGFNGAAATSESQLAHIFLTTTIAPAVATVVCMIFTWIKNKKPDVGMCLNASLAGLVGVTAGCYIVDAIGATVIGIVSGILVVVICELLDKKFHLDDPVGAIGVHFANGIWGTLACGLFSTETGLFYTGNFAQLGVQLLGMVSILVWTGIWMVLIFGAIKYLPVMIKNRCGLAAAIRAGKTWNGLRCSAEEEINGLDISEHGLPSAYADFLPSIPSYDGEGEGVDISGVKPADIDLTPVNEAKYTKITIITAQEKFLTLKDAMAQIGVTGMTVTNVMGCGTQAGKTGQYRGVKTTMHFNPKIQVDIVVSTVDPKLVVAVAQHVLDDGRYGAGKIFVTGIENVMRVRTGETGVQALTNDPEPVPAE